jgi:hypothetical protein
MFTKEKSPFNVDLRCNVSIEVNVAMRVGDLIISALKASGSEDKQLYALGYQLSNAMRNLVDGLDDRQWNRLNDYLEESSTNDYQKGQDHYSSSARQAMNEMPDYEGCDVPRDLKEIVRSRLKRPLPSRD